MSIRDKQPNIYDVAKSAECSIATVSRTINHPESVSNETFSRIKSVMKNLGYSPNLNAKNLAHRKNNLVAVLLPHHNDIHFSMIITPFLAGILQEAESSNVRIMLFPTRSSDNEENFHSYINSSAIDGVIMLNDISSTRTINLLEKEKLPLIYVNCTLDPSKHRVNNDNMLGARIAIDYLIELGHHNIAILNGSLHTISGKERFLGCKDVLKKHRLLRYLQRNRLLRDADFNQNTAYLLTTDMLSATIRPTAIFAASDWMALGVMAAIREKGLRIPKDISVIGFDNTVLSSQISPMLTTIHQPLKEMGQEAFKSLLSIDPHHKSVINVVLQPKLIIRETTGRLKC